MQQVDVLIIGAGPTGLGAALRLEEVSGVSYLVVEQQGQAGGLASSFRDPQGFTWDLGSHLQFSHYEKYDALLDAALPPEEWLVHPRRTYAWCAGGFVPYPFQFNLQALPPKARWRCVEGLLDVANESREADEDFQAWILNTFGKGIAELFLIPYNAKVWGCAPSEMSAHWILDRVPPPDLKRVLKSICLGEDNTAWGPNQTFRYPRRGGTGALWCAVADLLPRSRFRWQRSLSEVDVARRIATLDDGTRIQFQLLISTIPLTQLAAKLKSSEPLPDCHGLRHASTDVIGLGFSGSVPEALADKLWLYFAGGEFLFHRLTVLSNFSPDMTPRPGEDWSLMLEVSHDPAAKRPVSEVMDRVQKDLTRDGFLSEVPMPQSLWHRRLEYGYPVPSCGRDGILGELLPWLWERGIASRGRFGAWKYEVGNQDHSVMQGIEAVEAFLAGHSEITLFQPDVVNSRRNPFPYEEWSLADPEPSTEWGASLDGALCSAGDAKKRSPT